MITNKTYELYQNYQVLINEIKEIVPYLADLQPEIYNAIWSSGTVETNERMTIPKRIMGGTAVGFPWHEGATGRLTTPNYGTYKVSLIEELGGVSTDYSTTEVTGIRRSSYQTHNGLLMGIWNGSNGEIWYMPEPYGAITKVLDFQQGYAHPFSWTHNPATDDVWVTEYGVGKDGDIPRRVYRSDDGGANWTMAELDTVDAFDHIHTPIYHPPTGNLYVATGDNTGKKVYKSTDNGQTFTLITTPSALNRKLTAAFVRDDGIIVWGNDETPSGLYLHDTTTDEFTLIKIYTDDFRGYPATLNLTEKNVVLIPLRQDGYDAPGIIATKDYETFHRVLDTSQEGDYDFRGIESIHGADTEGHYYCRGLGTDEWNSGIIKSPDIYDAEEVNTSETEATSTINIDKNMSIVDCIVPSWDAIPEAETELIRLNYNGGYIKISLEDDGKISISDGTNTDTTGIQGDVRDLLIKWEGKYDAGVQFPFVLEVTDAETKIKVLNRVTGKWAIASIETIVPNGDCTIIVKAEAKHQIKTVSKVNSDAWNTLKQAQLAIF